MDALEHDGHAGVTDEHRQVRPHYGRATVLPSPVDETETASGIVLPVSDKGVDRGVLVAMDTTGTFRNVLVIGSTDDDDDDEPEEEEHPPLAKGCVVWYRHGVKIGDLVVVDLPDILAYEA